MVHVRPEIDQVLSEFLNSSERLCKQKGPLPLTPFFECRHMRLILSHSSLALRDRMGEEEQPKGTKIRFCSGVKKSP